MNKAILAAAIAVAAVAIFFAYSQFNTLDFRTPSIPSIQDVVNNNKGDSGNARSNLADEAFKIGRVSTVEAADQELTLPDLFAKTENSVVQVTASGDTSEGATLGTGFIFDDNGHIVTNNHVVSGEGSTLDVTFVDGTVYQAKLLGKDPFTDLAVLYVPDVPKDKLVPLPLADSTKIRVGEEVAAIGNPFGLSSSMTSGIISGIGRLIPSSEGSGSLQFFIPDVIQTDAPINPGNSGGPLLNTRGQVIGINTAIRSTSGSFEGIGFAVPANTIAKIAPALIQKGSFQHSWVGISGTDMTPSLAKILKLSEPRGVLIVDVVNGGPAAKAGLKGGDNPQKVDGRPINLGGDIILELDGNPVKKLDDILVYLQREKVVGDNLDLTILRDGQVKHVTVHLEARPTSQETP